MVSLLLTESVAEKWETTYSSDHDSEDEPSVAP